MNYAESIGWPQIPVPLIPRKKISTLYAFTKSDGVASGLVEYEGEYYYADRMNTAEYGFWLIKLDLDQQTYALNYGEQYAIYFSDVLVYTPRGHRRSRGKPTLGKAYTEKDGRAYKDESLEAEFYSIFPKPVRPSADAEVIGWFDEWIDYGEDGEDEEDA